MTEQPTAATATEEAGQAGDNNSSGPAAPKETEFTVEVHTDIPKIMEPETPGPMPARGDGPNNIPQVR